MSTNHNVTGESELYEQIKLDESKKNSSMNSSICINNSNYSSMDVNSTNPNSSYSSTTSSNRSYINCEKLRYNDEKSIVAKPPPIPPRIPLPPPKPFVEEFPCSCRDVHVDNVFSSYCTPQKHRYF
ncbi:hypothetical protein SNEBB_000524 [Seison nebaliae]|nr:hypothetical protein SNEBB_000524 [Seison nebaliae]